MKLSKLIMVVNLSLLVSLLSILKIIIGLAGNPPNSTYLAVGHYYMDYFEYLQQTAQGMMGHWTVLNQFATDDQTRTVLGWGQYLIIGKITKFFHLSVVTGYWLSVFILVFLFVFSIYLIIKKLLPKLSFSYQLLTWALCLFAAPFFAFEIGTNKIIPFDFWYAPMSFFHRFGGVPHQVLTGFLTVIILIMSSNLFDLIKTERFKKIIWKIVSLIVILVILLTFAPFQVINLISAIFLLGLISTVRDKKINNNLLYFLIFIVLVIFPTAWFIKMSHDSSGLFQRAILWETNQEYHPPISLILLTIGPILIFSFLGLRRYFKEISHVRWLLLFYVAFSFIYFSASLARYLGTFNLRFLSPSIYILFGTLGILGIIEISEWFGNKKKIIFTLISTVLLGYFLWMTTLIFISFGPVDQTSYLPNTIYNGMLFLGKQPEKRAVLTSPDKYYGLVVPVFADKNVYIARPIFTPDFENRLNIADQFYQGNIDPKDAKQLLLNHKIGFVFLTFAEKYSPENLKKYPFLKIIYDKEGVKVYKVF